MKKSIKIILVFLMMVFVACSEDNNYDGVNGLPSGTIDTSSIETAIEELFIEVIIKDSRAVYTQSQVLEQSILALNTNASEQNILQAQEEFKKLVLAYKRVEAIYVAGYNDANMRDIADFFLEQYIKGSKSQDISGDLDRVFAGQASLVANSLKGITALEYTLFGNNESRSILSSKMNITRTSSALTMSSKIKGHLLEIQEYYVNTSTFKSDSDKSVSALLNVLSQQSFNLRELRIGEPAGFTTKFLNNPSSTRLEYYNSEYSLESIQEILNTFKTVMDTSLSAIATIGNASSEAEAISDAIDEALVLTKSYSSTLESSLTDSKTLELYETIRTIQNNITALINGLNFQQDIIDADGD